MPAAPIIAMAVMMAAQAGTQAYMAANQGGQGGKGPIGGGPKPIQDLTPEQVTQNKTKYGETAMPAFLGLPTAMTPTQQRTAIAQGGVAGGAIETLENSEQAITGHPTRYDLWSSRC